MSQGFVRKFHPITDALTKWISTKRKYINQTYSALIASFTYFSMGEIRSWSASSIPSIQGKDGQNATLSQGPLSLETVSWITSATPLGAIFGALVAGFVLERFGSKVTMLLSAALTFLSFFVIATVKIYELPGVMIASRALMGLTVGLCMPSATTYISECMDAEIRGLLGSMPAVLMALGISFVYLIGTFWPWHIVSYICAVLPLVNFASILLAPESPYWLLVNRKYVQAEKAFYWLKGMTKSTEPMSKDDLKDAILSQKTVKVITENNEDEETKRDGISSWLKAMKTRPVWHPFTLCMMTMVFQQWSGVNAIIFNTVIIFDAAEAKVDRYLATNIVGAVQLIATLISAFIVDKAGRRILLLLSGIIMSISMAALGAFFYIFSEANEPVDPDLRDKLGWLPLTSLIVFMTGYSIGYASVPFLLLGELLPARVKNICSSIASSFNLAMIFFVLKFFPTLTLSIGFHGLFWIYSAFSLVGGIFGYVFIPETKGKSLKEIENYFLGIGKRDQQLSETLPC